jgi:hypothetical protein
MLSFGTTPYRLVYLPLEKQVKSGKFNVQRLTFRVQNSRFKVQGSRFSSNKLTN